MIVVAVGQDQRVVGEGVADRDKPVHGDRVAAAEAGDRSGKSAGATLDAPLSAGIELHRTESGDGLPEAA